MFILLISITPSCSTHQKATELNPFFVGYPVSVSFRLDMVNDKKITVTGPQKSEKPCDNNHFILWRFPPAVLILFMSCDILDMLGASQGMYMQKSSHISGGFFWLFSVGGLWPYPQIILTVLFSLENDWYYTMFIYTILFIFWIISLYQPIRPKESATKFVFFNLLLELRFKSFIVQCSHKSHWDLFVYLFCYRGKSYQSKGRNSDALAAPNSPRPSVYLTGL